VNPGAAATAPPVAAPAAPAPLTLPVFPSNCPGGQPKEPIAYGTCELELAKGRAKSTARVRVLLAADPDGKTSLEAAQIQLDARPESYAIVASGDETQVVGSDGVGAMYGALDLAERLDMDGASALPIRAPVAASPATRIRGANPFLILQMQGEQTWWFRDPAFWTEFLDMMARGRLNFLDLHGMANFYNTNFPNVLVWFATSSTFPQIGIPKDERDKNLAMLSGIVQMAHARGIRVGVMTYRSDVSVLAEKDEELEERQTEQYTREAVYDLVARSPGLAYFGFRVGESKHEAEWFTGTIVEAIKAANTGTLAYTRTWRTSKKGLLPVLEAAGPDAIVEAKYNGEHFGAPYVISGGHMPGWHSYSYEDYLTPPYPYRFVMQVWGGATNRIFRYASYERTARTVRSLGLSPQIQGFSYEAANTYGPQRDFYHQNPSDVFSPWTFRRDELAYLLFGRLGYDPKTPEKIFRTMLSERVGTTELWDSVQAASDIVQWIQTGHTCGPDQREYAPELEVGGTVAYWAQPEHAPPGTPPPATPCSRGPVAFDSFSIATPAEAAEDLIHGRGTSRLSPADVAQIVLADAKRARAAAKVKIDPANAEARDYARECVAVADLGEWFAHKLRGASALAVYERTGEAEWASAAKSEVASSAEAFRALANDTAYIAPFDELMRMRKLGHPKFHWREELSLLDKDAESLEEVVQNVRAHPPKAAAPVATRPKAWLDAVRGGGPGLAQIAISPLQANAPSWTVTVTLASPPPPGAQVNVLHRPFKSTGPDWVAVPASGSGASWSATVPGAGEGGMFAVEVLGGPGKSFRYPDPRYETPYRAVAP
jgi:hypothetical protein